MSETVRDNNLYANGAVIVFDNGEEALYREPLVIEPKNDDKYHTVTTFDMLDALAYKYYSPFVEDASKYWWVIADANNIQNPLELEEYVGKQILVPNILRIRLQL